MRKIRVFDWVVATSPTFQDTGFVVAYDLQFGPRVTGLPIVVTTNQMHLQLRAIRSPFQKKVFHGFASSLSGMKEIAKKNDFFALGLLAKCQKFSAIILGVFIGYRDACRSEGRGFAEMRISDEKRILGRPMDGLFRKQVEGFFLPSNIHGQVKTHEGTSLRFQGPLPFFEPGLPMIRCSLGYGAIRPKAESQKESVVGFF